MNRLTRAVTTIMLGAFALSVVPARAHHGFESDIQIRLLNQQTFVVMRMTVSVAARLLGEGAPMAWSDAIVAEQQSRLRALADTLLVVKTGETALVPIFTKAALEVSGQLAFVLIYPPAKAWPVIVEAAYFKNPPPEFTGKIHVFGPPQQPTERCGPEFASLELSATTNLLNISSPP